MTRGSKTQGKLDAAVLEAQKTVRPVHATKSGQSPPRQGQQEGDCWDYPPIEEVREVTYEALRGQGVSLTVPETRTQESTVTVVLRLSHPASGEWVENDWTWARFNGAAFNDVPLAVAATVNHVWRHYALNLLGPKVLSREAVTTEPRFGSSGVTNTGLVTEDGYVLERAQPKPDGEAKNWQPWDRVPVDVESIDERVIEVITDLHLRWKDRQNEFRRRNGQPKLELTLAQTWSSLFPDEATKVPTTAQYHRLAARLMTELRGEELPS